jgi:hypothetical protein
MHLLLHLPESNTFTWLLLESQAVQSSFLGPVHVLQLELQLRHNWAERKDPGGHWFRQEPLLL